MWIAPERWQRGEGTISPRSRPLARSGVAAAVSALLTATTAPANAAECGRSYPVGAGDPGNIIKNNYCLEGESLADHPLTEDDGSPLPHKRVKYEGNSWSVHGARDIIASIALGVLKRDLHTRTLSPGNHVCLPPILEVPGIATLYLCPSQVPPSPPPIPAPPIKEGPSGASGSTTVAPGPAAPNGGVIPLSGRDEKTPEDVRRKRLDTLEADLDRQRRMQRVAPIITVVVGGLGFIIGTGFGIGWARENSELSCLQGTMCTNPQDMIDKRTSYSYAFSVLVPTGASAVILGSLWLNAVNRRLSAIGRLDITGEPHGVQFAFRY